MYIYIYIYMCSNFCLSRVATGYCQFLFVFLGRCSKLMDTIFHISKTSCVFPGIAMGVFTSVFLVKNRGDFWIKESAE